MEISDTYQNNGESSGSSSNTPDADFVYSQLQKRIFENSKFKAKVKIEFTSNVLEHSFPKGHYIRNLKFIDMKTDTLNLIDNLSLLGGTIRSNNLMDTFDIVDRVCGDESPELKNYPDTMTFSKHIKFCEMIKNRPELLEKGEQIKVGPTHVPLYNIVRDGMIIPNEASVIIKLKLKLLENAVFDRMKIEYELYEVDNKVLDETSVLMGHMQKPNKENWGKTKKD